LNAAIRAVSPMPEGSLRDCSQEVVDACRDAAHIAIATGIAGRADVVMIPRDTVSRRNGGGAYRPVTGATGAISRSSSMYPSPLRSPCRICVDSDSALRTVRASGNLSG